MRLSPLPRITANGAGASLVVYAVEQVTASTTTRTLSGTVVRFGVLGRTSAGRLRVRPGALTFPEDLSRVKLTREHERDQARGHLAMLSVDGERIRASLKVSDGPEGDAALREAGDKTRDGLSFDVVDAVIEGDEIVSAEVIAIGQVGIPAYTDGRVESIAASQGSTEPTQTPGATPAPAPAEPAVPTTTPEGTTMLTEQERARLTELRAMSNRTAEQTAELTALATKAGEPIEGPAAPEPAAPTAAAPAAAAPVAPAPVPVAASYAAVPGGVPAPTGAATTSPRGGALAAMCQGLADALGPNGGATTQAITAALADVTHATHSNVIEAPAWSGELWSGLQYEPQFTDLLATDTLTNFEGRGWRFKTKMTIQDYAGNKVEIPTSTVETEQSSYEAARMAVGVDVDRKFYDFPNAAFIQSLAEQVRESWAIQLDNKVRAWIAANAVAAEGVTTQTQLLKAAGLAIRALKRRKVGRADYVLVNDEDLFTLMDLTNDDLPAFLKLFNIEPENFRSSQDVAQGTVLAGVRRTGTLRTLPGSPIRVSAQAIAKGGVDEAWFGYWAIEEHHTAGIASVTFDPDFVPA